jgi:CheY-like chemotaxis protein
MGKLVKFIVKVLVIDDDKKTTKMISKILNYLEFEFLVTNDPMVGLKKIRREHFDVILLNIDVPVVSGFGVIEMLAGADILKDQNIFVFSGTTLPELQLKNLVRRDGVNGFLKKPIDFEKLVNAISG